MSEQQPRMCGICHKPVEPAQARCSPCNASRPEDGWPADSRVGQTVFGRLTLTRRLGYGTSGVIYLAQDPEGDRVAVKVLYPELTRDSRFLKRFKVEAAITKSLSIPQIVRTFDFGVMEDGTHYLTMEYVAGFSLDKLLASWGRLKIDNAIEVARQVLVALEVAHSRRIVHRDLKPGNLILSKDSSGNPLVKILDFGFAKVVADERQGLMRPMRVTTGLVILGTPQYMSPEQAEGKPDIDGRTDLYSMGAILYKMLTGVPPFQAQRPIDIIQKQLTEQSRPPSRLRPNLPPALDRIVLKLLEKDRNRRYRTAGEVIEDLDRVFGPARYQPDVAELMDVAAEPSELIEQVGRYVRDWSEVPGSKRMTSAKNLALLLAVALAGCGVGGVIVWLMSK